MVCHNLELRFFRSIQHHKERTVRTREYNARIGGKILFRFANYILLAFCVVIVGMVAVRLVPGL